MLVFGYKCEKLVPVEREKSPVMSPVRAGEGCFREMRNLEGVLNGSAIDREYGSAGFRSR